MLTYVTLLRLTLVMGYIEYIEGYMTGFCFVKTKRNVHSLEMQIGADSSYVVTLILTNSDLDLLNPKSIGFDTCRGLLLCQVSSHCDQGFSFYRANIHTHIHTHTHTQRDEVIAVSAPTYYVVGVDNKNNNNNNDNDNNTIFAMWGSNKLQLKLLQKVTFFQ